MLALRRERHRRGWSLIDVCGKTGINPSTLSEIERGLRNCYPGWRRRICKAFNMPEEELFAEVPDEGKEH